VCAVRAVELARIGRVSVRTALFAGVLMWADGQSSWLLGALIGAVASFALLSLARSAYRSVLMHARRQGRYRRRVVVIGTDDGGAMLVDHIRRNPASGFSVVGVMGDSDEHLARKIPAPYLGSIDNVARAAQAVGANGAIVSAGALPLAKLNELTHDLLDNDLHVQITAGLHGFSHQRVTANDLAYEPLLYVEPIQLSRSQAAVKRALDLLIAPLVLIVILPALAIIAITIKLTSHGPVIYRQRRVGRNNEQFTFYKFRTMIDGAEHHADTLAEHNERTGPLFKLDDDPRVTRIGRLLRATSLDEIPQLWNVINGTMSFVGPRPALPAEVACFDHDLLRRFSVPPGITGLWQLEARDEPDFEAYRRLDLFYVENWSLSLDLAIMVGTIADVVVRAVTQLRRRSPHA
jgi:exopolysaccharide biosynthesis polyprenyl glycosylphosphotransferase